MLVTKESIIVIFMCKCNHGGNWISLVCYEKHILLQGLKIKFMSFYIFCIIYIIFLFNTNENFLHKEKLKLQYISISFYVFLSSF